MKKYYFLLGVLCAIAVAAGIDARRVPVVTQSPNHVDVVQPTTRPTAVYEWGDIEIEPFLYAVPLGTFMPDKRLNIVELPNSANKVGELPANEPAGFTSEYRNNGNLWLCVVWDVGETIASWECTGWVLAESTDGSYGTVDRAYEYTPAEIGKGQDA